MKLKAEFLLILSLFCVLSACKRPSTDPSAPDPAEMSSLVNYVQKYEIAIKRSEFEESEIYKKRVTNWSKPIQTYSRNDVSGLLKFNYNADNKSIVISLNAYEVMPEKIPEIQRILAGRVESGRPIKTLQLDVEQNNTSNAMKMLLIGLATSLSNVPNHGAPQSPSYERVMTYTAKDLPAPINYQVDVDMARKIMKSPCDWFEVQLNLSIGNSVVLNSMSGRTARNLDELETGSVVHFIDGSDLVIRVVDVSNGKVVGEFKI